MHGNGNPNWLNKFFGGMILAGFVVVAIVAGLFSLATWSMAHGIIRRRGTN